MGEPERSAGGGCVTAHIRNDARDGGRSMEEGPNVL